MRAKLTITNASGAELTLPPTLESKVLADSASEEFIIETNNLRKEWLNNDPSMVKDIQALVDAGDVTVAVEGLQTSVINDVLAMVESATAAAGTLKGTASIAAATSVAVTFDDALSTDEYNVQLTALEDNSVEGPLWVSDKLTTGFTINIGASWTGDVDWVVRR
jgi:hypothetical protein